MVIPNVNLYAKLLRTGLLGNRNIYVIYPDIYFSVYLLGGIQGMKKVILALKTNCVNVFNEENRSNNKIKTKFHFTYTHTYACVCVCIVHTVCI